MRVPMSTRPELKRGGVRATMVLSLTTTTSNAVVPPNVSSTGPLVKPVPVTVT